MTGQGTLLAVTPDGQHYPIDNEYRAVKAALNEATIDCVRVNRDAAFFINDNGMIDGTEVLNFPASMFAGRSIWGPVVLLHADADDEGNEQPPTDAAIAAMALLCAQWQRVQHSLITTGQEVPVIRPNPDTVPPPQIIDLGPELEAFFGRPE